MIATRGVLCLYTIHKPTLICRSSTKMILESYKVSYNSSLSAESSASPSSSYTPPPSWPHGDNQLGVLLLGANHQQASIHHGMRIAAHVPFFKERAPSYAIINAHAKHAIARPHIHQTRANHRYTIIQLSFHSQNRKSAHFATLPTLAKGCIAHLHIRCVAQSAVICGVRPSHSANGQMRWLSARIIHHATSARLMASEVTNRFVTRTRLVGTPSISRIGRGANKSRPLFANTCSMRFKSA
jgi:hypothetical protein